MQPYKPMLTILPPSKINVKFILKETKTSEQLYLNSKFIRKRLFVWKSLTQLRSNFFPIAEVFLYAKVFRNYAKGIKQVQPVI